MGFSIQHYVCVEEKLNVFLKRMEAELNAKIRISKQ